MLTASLWSVLRPVCRKKGAGCRRCGWRSLLITPTPTPAPTPTPLGDFNLSVEALWKTGWPNALGAAAAICLPEGSHSCRLAGSESSLIDYALVSRKLHRILKLNLRGMGLDGKFD